MAQKKFFLNYPTIFPFVSLSFIANAPLWWYDPCEVMCFTVQIVQKLSQNFLKSHRSHFQNLWRAQDTREVPIIIDTNLKDKGIYVVLFSFNMKCYKTPYQLYAWNKANQVTILSSLLIFNEYHLFIPISIHQSLLSEPFHHEDTVSYSIFFIYGKVLHCIWSCSYTTSKNCEIWQDDWSGILTGRPNILKS